MAQTSATQQKKFASHQLQIEKCACSICQKQCLKLHFSSHKFGDPNQGQIYLHTNDLQQFIECSQYGSIIPIVPTNLIGLSCHVFNRKKIKLSCYPLQNGPIQNFPNANYLVLYYKNTEKIISRFDIRKGQYQGYEYVQIYNKSSSLFSIYYKKEGRNYLKDSQVQVKQSSKVQNDIDDVIIENLKSCINKLTKYLGNTDKNLRNKTNKHYGRPTNHLNLIEVDQFYQKQKDFHNWVIKQYGHETLAKYLIETHIQVVRNLTGNQILSGTFQWLLQTQPNPISFNKPLKIIKLVNVRDLVVEKFIGQRTFQNQYQEKVWAKIDTLCHQMIKINLFDDHHNLKRKNVWKGSQQMFNNHLNKFKNEIRGIYQRQKDRSLKKLQEEKHVYRSDDVQNILRDNLIATFLNPKSGSYQGHQKINNNDLYIASLGQMISARNQRSRSQLKKYRLKSQKSSNGQKRSSSLIYQPQINQGIVKLKIRQQPEIRTRRIKTLT